MALTCRVEEPSTASEADVADRPVRCVQLPQDQTGGVSYFRHTAIHLSCYENAVPTFIAALQEADISFHRNPIREAEMSVEGIILHHGEAGGVTSHQTRVDYLLTAEHSKQCSLFEFSIAPGFNTGAHYHTKIEEIFYVLEGEVDLRCGERTERGGPGTFVFVPPGAAHAFGNSGAAPARMLLITAPPGHEKYFDELRDLIAKGGKPDPEALAKLRAKYDTIQLATLTAG
jgi:quercetin dioxygenase-like cupin family protein